MKCLETQVGCMATTILKNITEDLMRTYHTLGKDIPRDLMRKYGDLNHYLMIQKGSNLWITSVYENYTNEAFCAEKVKFI